MYAAALLCLAVGITDGDTLKVRCGEAPQQIIRLAEIDAPEAKQPWGQRSKQALASLCFQQQAQVWPVSTDRYGRLVARVECAGVDVANSLVSAGLAWVFDRYAAKASPLYGLQDAARQARLGLRADPAPVPPWQWRRD